MAAIWLADNGASILFITDLIVKLHRMIPFISTVIAYNISKQWLIQIFRLEGGSIDRCLPLPLLLLSAVINSE